MAKDPLFVNKKAARQSGQIAVYSAYGFSGGIINTGAYSEIMFFNQLFQQDLML
jgi:hypothetical protein